MGRTVTNSTRAAAHLLSADIAIATRAGDAIRSHNQPHGRSARVAPAWTDTLHNRAQRAAERRRRATTLR
jgi:hypothetical protein